MVTIKLDHLSVAGFARLLLPNRYVKYMNIQQTIHDLTSLAVEDRLRIAQLLWDSIPPESEVNVSAEQKQELLRRLAEHDANPESAISLEELQRRLKDRG